MSEVASAIRTVPHVVIAIVATDEAKNIVGCLGSLDGSIFRMLRQGQRVNFDLDYLRHWSPMLDIKIILLTVVKVFRDDKAY